MSGREGSDVDDSLEAYEQSNRSANGRLIVTHEGNLDPSLLLRTTGYIYKKGGAVNARGGFRNWKKRWFILSPVDFFGFQGYELQYYDTPNGTQKGTVPLNDIEISITSKSNNRNVKFEFQLTLQNGTELQLSCDRENERDEWVQTLQMVTAFMQKIVTSAAMTLDGYDPMAEDEEESYRIGDEVAQNCQAYGPGLFGAEAGKSAQFVVQVHDMTGQKVTMGGMPVVVTIYNNDSLFYVSVNDNDDGTYFAHYTMMQCGKYQLSIKLNDEHHIFGSPFEIEIMPSKTIPKYCIAEGEALKRVAMKSSATFTVYAMDGFGNRKTRGGDPFEVGVMGAAQLTDLQDNGDGSYLCTVSTIQQAGMSGPYAAPTLMIIVTLYGKPIRGSPFKPLVLTATSPAPTIVGGSGAGSIGRGGSAGGKAVSAAAALSPPMSKVRSASIKPTDPALSPPIAAGAPREVAPASASRTGPEPASAEAPAAYESRVAPASVVVSASPATASSTGANVGSNAMSRLERSRQRALLAKNLSDEPEYPQQQRSVDRVPATAPVQSANRVIVGVEPPLSVSMAGMTSTAKLSQLAARSKMTLEAMKAGTHNTDTNRAVAVNSAVHDLAVQLRQGLGGRGIGAPEGVSSLEQRAWDNTQQALSSAVVVEKLCEYAEILNQVFSVFADRMEGVNIIKLSSTNKGGHGGAFRLLELYEITPTFMSRLEAKAMFSLAAHAQRIAQASAATSGGLDFPSFVKFLVLTTHCAMAKAAASIVEGYPSHESKMEFMLFKWGLADGNRLQIVRQMLSGR